MGADDDKDAAPPTTGLKMSMTMTSKPKKALGATASGFAKASELRDAEAKKESVEEVVEGNIGKDNEPVIIPGAGNTFHLGGAQHLRPGALQTSEEAEEAEMAQAEAGMSLTDESAGAPAAPTGTAVPRGVKVARSEGAIGRGGMLTSDAWQTGLLSCGSKPRSPQLSPPSSLIATALPRRASARWRIMSSTEPLGSCAI